ncbi:hydrogenase maturation nickel metallochaperone HypA [Candidatus Bathyarchaeota archaeon]|nr:MAG: hydrogenase maturation nickel metallochaperone HypA [Candidatus Bathyarchaeota archaeon]
MHEFSAASQLVDLVLAEAEKRKAKRVVEVNLIIGRLSFLNPEQVKFAYEILSKDTLLEGSKLNVQEKPPLVECPKCGYKGGIEVKDDPYFHLGIPLLRCPKCGGEVKIVEGREFIVKSIKIEV